MSFPEWFSQSLQGRLEEVLARFEHDSDFRSVREEESEAFQTLFASLGIGRMQEFTDWEDKHQFRQAILYEHLYLQGMKDGAQLATVLISDDF